MYILRRLPPLVIGVGVAGAVYGGACKQIDTSDADAKLSKWASDMVAPVRSVDCPSHVSEKAGVAFDCKVTFVAGKVATLHVEQRDDKGDVRYFWTPPIVGADKANHLLAESLGAPWKGAAVDCGQGIVDVPPDGLRCGVALADKHEHVVLMITDGKVTTREEP